jgi:hypothetical protein
MIVLDLVPKHHAVNFPFSPITYTPAEFFFWLCGIFQPAVVLIGNG